ncbi:MAG TPA: hypothetical protein PKV95_06590, partial [Anaerolineaceae bacterium]|nr:hypothetical protein [Anaerolineaceae bacterium]
MNPSVWVDFQPLGRRVQADSSRTLLDAARAAGVARVAGAPRAAGVARVAGASRASFAVIPTGGRDESQTDRY